MGKTTKINYTFKKTGSLVIVILIFIAVTNITLYITDILLKGSFRYTWLFVNHSLQLIIVLGLMVLPIWLNKLSDWGINTNNKQLTFNIIKKFAIGWILFTTAYIALTSWINNWPYLLDFELNLKNALIYLLFESTIVGLSEEIFFRGFIYSILQKYFGKKIRIIRFSISQAGIITALIFAFAHIGFHIFPLSIISFDIMQFVMAFALGIFYAFILEKTGSLLGPILAHNISDLWLSILYIVIQLIAKGF